MSYSNPAEWPIADEVSRGAGGTKARGWKSGSKLAGRLTAVVRYYSATKSSAATQHPATVAQPVVPAATGRSCSGKVKEITVSPPGLQILHVPPLKKKINCLFL